MKIYMLPDEEICHFTDKILPPILVRRFRIFRSTRIAHILADLIKNQLSNIYLFNEYYMINTINEKHKSYTIIDNIKSSSN